MAKPTLRDLRLKAGLSQSDVANALNSDVAKVSRWERGITVPHLFAAQDLAAILGVSMEDVAKALRLNQQSK